MANKISKLTKGGKLDGRTSMGRAASGKSGQKKSMVNKIMGKKK